MKHVQDAIERWTSKGNLRRCLWLISAIVFAWLWLTSQRFNAPWQWLKTLVSTEWLFPFLVGTLLVLVMVVACRYILGQILDTLIPLFKGKAFAMIHFTPAIKAVIGIILFRYAGRMIFWLMRFIDGLFNMTTLTNLFQHPILMRTLNTVLNDAHRGLIIGVMVILMALAIKQYQQSMIVKLPYLSHMLVTPISHLFEVLPTALFIIYGYQVLQLIPLT